VKKVIALGREYGEINKEASYKSIVQILLDKVLMVGMQYKN
jgi:hypothetical protein